MDEREIRGDHVAITLILSLVAFMMAVFYIVLIALQPGDKRVLLAPFARLSHSAFAAIGILASFTAFRAKKRRWWLYGVLALIPIVQYFVPLLYWIRSKEEKEKFVA